MKILTLAILVMATYALTACNTFEGIGKDLQSGGQAIENAAS